MSGKDDFSAVSPESGDPLTNGAKRIPPTVTG
jgi:hypothetical protein